MVHGGAGELRNLTSERQKRPYIESICRVLDQGREILAQGGRALEAVEACAIMLENDPLFNAGRGSVLNEEGRVEMDAAIMDGESLQAGAVAGVIGVKNPIQLASLVLSRCEHVMLIGEGAMKFGQRFAVPTEPEAWFYTQERIEQWQRARESDSIGLDHDDAASLIPKEGADKYGTIGVVARDNYSGLAAATSTGGIVNKRFGRVGDSPIIGAGVYADSESCAVSCTGFGEDFLRTTLAKRIADIIDLTAVSAPEAASSAIDYLVRRVNGRGGVIVIDREGNCGAALSTRRMIHGWIEHGGDNQCRF
ncbi:isoaspartyl peptidase/L-asparaginase [Ectothiorhodospiraceae bacterium BW-2]|nr:isoaspartyl peptidase/L-asparaginase [Ectothiorhodospiraceae bacterium BW-2]